MPLPRWVLSLAPASTALRIVATSAAVWPKATTTPLSTARRISAIAPGRSGARVRIAIRRPEASCNSSNKSQSGSRMASIGCAPRYPSRSERKGPSRWMPTTFEAMSGSASQARGDRLQSVEQVLDRCRDQGRAEPSGAEARLGADDLNHPIDAQVRAGEGMPPATVRLDVPERRRDPLIVRLDLGGALDGINPGDPPGLDLQLDPSRIAVMPRGDDHRRVSGLGHSRCAGRSDDDRSRFGLDPGPPFESSRVGGARRRRILGTRDVPAWAST